MGVADNRSYKQEYHFRDDRNIAPADYPSVESDPKINTTIKANPYKSNVEIEGKEIVLQPDLSALFKAVGNRHSKGGMDVLLKPESFIFSDFKDLAITPKEHELFELKEGGTKRPLTPAEVLKKNVNVKHYNTLVTIMDDPYKDDLAKKSAALMLEKYISTLGNIAYIQEQKKGFPDGIPAFSQGTAPVYDPNVKEDIMANKQYMKAGGAVNNPYMQNGGGFNAQRYQQLQQKGRLSRQEAQEYRMLQDQMRPAAFDAMAPFKQQVPQQQQFWDNPQTPKPQGFDWTNPAPATPKQQQQQQFWDTTTPPPQNPQTAKVNAAKENNNPWGAWQGDQQNIFQNRYGVTNAADKLTDVGGLADKLGYNGPKNNLAFQHWLYNSSPENKAVIDKWHNKYNQGPNAGMFDGKIGIRWANALKEISTRVPHVNLNIPGTFSEPPPEAQTPAAPAQAKGPEVPNLDVTAQGSKQADWKFTPWQKISQLYNAGQMANVKRYMPYRSRYNATYVDPALVNPEQAIGDVKGMANQQLSSVGTLNPILRNAQAASIAGQVMNQAPGIRAQYDNQNAQILNQSRMYNNQVKNNESLVNMGNDQQYYKEAVEGRKNFDNMRQFTSNNYMNNVMRDVETDQKLSYNMLQQNNPAYGYDWNTGNFTRNKQNILDVQTNNVNSRYAEIQQMLEGISDPLEKAKLAVKIEGLKVFGSAQNNNNPFKKGGKVKKNPYK